MYRNTTPDRHRLLPSTRRASFNLNAAQRAKRPALTDLWRRWRSSNRTR